MAEQEFSEQEKATIETLNNEITRLNTAISNLNSIKEEISSAFPKQNHFDDRHNIIGVNYEKVSTHLNWWWEKYNAKLYSIDRAIETINSTIKSKNSQKSNL